MTDDLISRQTAIDEYIMKCPYFSGKNTIDRSNIGTHIGSCDLEHHYRKVCPSNECLCAERLGFKKVQSAQPEITNEEIRFALKQLGAYFSIKIRNNKEGNVPVELLQHVEEIQEYVDNLPSAEPDLKHGKWIKNEGRHGWHCSECMKDNCYAYAWSSETRSGAVLQEVLQDYYCPNCGAKMDEDK